MSFTPILPYSGHDGWAYLRETKSAQQAKADAALPVLDQVDLDHFLLTIADAKNADDLLENPLNLRVAMRAFGLGDAIPTKAFVKKMLETSTAGEDARTRFPDGRWYDLSKAFGFGDARATPLTAAPGFADGVAARYRIAHFEEAVGAADPEMRAALAFDRTLSSLAAGGFSEEEGWRQALADDGAMRVLRTALDLGSGFDARTETERITTLRDAAEELTGSRKIDAFAAPDQRDAALKLFFARAKGPASAGLGFAKPQISGDGVAAWRLLEASLDSQQAGFARATARDPDLAYFARKIEAATTAADLVADARLRETALEAFGLGDAAPTEEFVAAVLNSAADDPESFANGLDDPRWREMAAFFGYGDGAGARVREFGFAEDFTARWRIAGFEAAVGAQDDDLRRALVFDRAMSALVDAGLGEDETLARALGHPTLAIVLQKALDLPGDFTQRADDERVALLRDALKSATGVDDLSALAKESARDDFIKRYLAAATADPPKGGGLGRPTLPLTGLAGWRFLQRTLPEQRATFEASADVRRETDYFLSRIGKVETVDDLMKDRRLLGVALEAFGLRDEIGKGAFIRKALEEGTEDGSALAVRLVDPRYREMSEAFGFGDGKGAQTRTDGFAEMVVARYRIRAFERAVGESDDTMRLALNFERTAEALSRQPISESAGWYRLLGDAPMRAVVESAFALPSEFSQIDIDKQVEVVRARTQRLVGSDSFRAFADAETRQKMITQYFARTQIENGASGPVKGMSALMILQSGQPASGLLNLLA